MKNLTYTSILLWGIILFCQYPLGAQDQDLIYGKIFTVDGKTYQGQIRWGKEEATWMDIFNSSKIDNPNLEYLSREDYALLEENRRQAEARTNRWYNVFTEAKEWNWKDRYVHIFACQFGEIQRIQLHRRDEVAVTLRNGDKISLEGGSNDIGTKVQILDQEIGLIKLNWDRIDYVEFMETPSQLSNKMGAPLYGTVQTSEGAFTGFIQWDHDERLSNDKLDGDSEDGDLSIAFEKIQRIEKERRGSKVILKSGREFYLTGTNDVNSENRGIIVNIPNQGRVDIPWRAFEQVAFQATPANAGLKYNDYPSIQALRGTLTTLDGRKFQGEIIYDLDEAWSYEMLHGSKNDIDYLIPFKYIREISPKNLDFTVIKLKDNQEIILGDSQDVSDKHQGVLVANGSKNMTYIPWQDVKSIQF